MGAPSVVAHVLRVLGLADNETTTMPNRQYLRRARRTPRNFARMLLPHERDESADPSRAGADARPEMKQAQDDLAKGREDTDCHSQPRPSDGPREGSTRNERKD
jgi:hypothetical protein